jgi:hypothetical protein
LDKHIFEFKMPTCPVKTAAQLRAIPEERRQQTIEWSLGNMWIEINNAAAAGRTFYIHKIDTRSLLSSSYPPQYIVTTDDLIEGLRMKFPDCQVYTFETRLQNGTIAEQGIRIDWS